MSVVFDPSKLLKKISDEQIEALLKANLTLKKSAVRFVEEIDFIAIDKKKVTDVALKVLKSYRERVADAEKGTKAIVREEILEDPKLLIQRVHNEVVFQAHEEIKQTFKGERAIWLPSTANEPRPEHQLNYGKEYTIGEGIDGVEPGDEYGCQCGVEIINGQIEELNLEK